MISEDHVTLMLKESIHTETAGFDHMTSVSEQKRDPCVRCVCGSECGSGGSCSGAGADAGPRAADEPASALTEGAGDGRHEAADAGAAGGAPEPAGRQAHAGHGDQRLPQDAGGRGEAVRIQSSFQRFTLNKSVLPAVLYSCVTLEHKTRLK